MRRTLALLSAGLLLDLLIVPTWAQDGLAPDGEANETYYTPFPLTITLDGDLSDWEGVPKVSHHEAVSADDPNFTFAAAADDEFLYFMGDVTDTNIISGQHGADYWNEDSIEFYVNATGDLSLNRYEDGVAQMTIPAVNTELRSEETVLSGVQGASAEATIYAFKTETGYAVEVAVPLKNDVWDIQPQHGGTIGFQVHLNGASTADRDTKLIWSAKDRSDQSYLNPSLFGTLIFFEIGRSDIPVLAAPTLVPTAVAAAEDAPYKNPDLPVEARVADLMARMTLDEKIGQMTLVEKNSIVPEDIIDWTIGGLLSGGGGYPRTNNAESWAEMVNEFQDYALQTPLAIPLIYGVDAVHGHGNLQGATIFPHNIGLGATRDPELVQRVCQATAEEMIATGIYWNYSPVVAVPQDIRWGRTYEGFSENSEVVSSLASACVLGLQGEQLGGVHSVLATPKHFVGDGGAVWGSSTTNGYMIDQGVTDIDEATLRAIHLPPYQAVIDGGAMSIMASFSSWGGMKMHAQKYLLTDVLKGELGFEGFIVSDWQAIDQIPGGYYDDVVTAINAGIDMNMVPYDYKSFFNTLTEAVENGDVPMERIDDAVRRILTVKFQMGLFEHPFSDDSLLATVGSDAHRAIAREAVSKSLVLLQNNDGALPLAKDTPTIFLAGEAADNIGIQSGGWTIEWQGKLGGITPGTTILEAIEVTVSGDTTVEYDRFGNFRNVNDASGNPLVADVGVVVVGEQPYAEGPGDSPNPALKPTDANLIERVRERSNTLVVILLSGRPLVISDQLALSDAFIAAWLPGTEGQGVADVLFGDVPFTGKLAYTWPCSVEQIPFDFANLRTAGCDAPLFPFGYGLDTATEQTLTVEDC